jgi:hypothetical protein
MFDTGCWMLDLGVSPSAFAASCLRVKKSDLRTRTSLFLTVTLHQDTHGGAEALRPCRSRGPRPSSKKKDFCRQKAQKAQKYPLVGFAPYVRLIFGCRMLGQGSVLTAKGRESGSAARERGYPQPVFLLPSSRTLMTERNGWLNLFLPPARCAC